MILVDTREKPKAIRSILEYFDKNRIEYRLQKLDYGDYMDPEHPTVVIDRKQTIAELASNVGTKDRERFKREIDRIPKGSRLVILVEQNRYQDRGEWIHIKDISDLMCWSSPYTMVLGERVYRILVSWCAKYPISVEFCDKRSTGRKIAEILSEAKAEACKG